MEMCRAIRLVENEMSKSVSDWSMREGKNTLMNDVNSLEMALMDKDAN